MKLPSWCRSLFRVEASTDGMEKTETIDIIDPNVMGEAIAKVQPLTISIVAGEDGVATVVAFWSNSLEKVYEKKEKSLGEADNRFIDLTSKASRIMETISNGSMDEAAEASKTFLTDLKMAANPPAKPSEKPVVDLVQTVGELKEGQFTFQESFLAALLRPVDVRTSPSGVFKGSFPTYVYATHSKNHIGSDNFVLQWFPKILTSEGMIQNVAAVERNSASGSTYFTVPDCDRTRFEKLCRYLTPTYADIGYELRDGALTKKANVSILYFDTPQDAATYQKAVTPGAPPEAGSAAPALPKELEDAGKALAGAEPGGAKGAPKGPAQAKMDEQEKELKEATSSLRTEAKAKKEEDGLSKWEKPAETAFDGTESYGLSKFDGSNPLPEKPQSADAVYTVSYQDDLATYALEMARGWTQHLDRDTAKSYLLNEGYTLEEADAHLAAAKKGQVTLRKKAAVLNDSSFVIKAAITKALKVAPMKRETLIAHTRDIVDDATEAMVDEALADLRHREVVDTNRDGLHHLAEVEDRFVEIASLLKSSVSRRKNFSKLVETSAKKSEIETADLDRFTMALRSAEADDNEDSWMKLAKVADELFQKAKKKGV